DGPGGPNRLETFVSDLFRVAYRHGLYGPPSATLLIKAIVTIEGVARSLNPNLNVVATAVPIVLSSLRPQWLRWRFWRDWSFMEACGDSPLHRAAERGVVRLGLRVSGAIRLCRAAERGADCGA